MTVEQILYFGMLGAALLAFIGILCTIPHRRKKIAARAGNCLMPLKVKPSKKEQIAPLIRSCSGKPRFSVLRLNRGFLIHVKAS